MLRHILLFLLIGLAGMANSAAARTVLVFGDSLSAGYGLASQQAWPSLLAAELPAGWRLINASQSGETSAGGLTRLPAALRQHQPAVVLLELGGNDGLRGLPLPQTQRNLGEMIVLSQRAGAKVLLLGMRLPPNFGATYGAKFSALYQDLARQHKAALLPFLLDGFAEQTALFQPDQIHPTAAAQPRIVANVKSKLLPLLR